MNKPNKLKPFTKPIFSNLYTKTGKFIIKTLQQNNKQAFWMGILLFMWCINAKCQDVVAIHHQFYESYFSKSKHIPVVVEFGLSKAMLLCDTAQKAHRKGKRFTKDPYLPEATNIGKSYVKSGYDRGHNMSAADNACNEIGMRECFYFSNMTPQPHFFNAGIWEKLENEERKTAILYDSIHVFVGSIGENSKIGVHGVVVPEHMWKVIYIPRQKKYACYWFSNTTLSNKPLENYQTTLETIEQKAAVRFEEGKIRLLQATEEAVEKHHSLTE